MKKENDLFYRVCNGVSDYGTYVPANKDLSKVIKDHGTDHYRSIYLYSKEQVEKAKETITVKKNNKTYKRPRGVAGVTDVVTNELVWDFDDKDNLERAKSDAQELIKRLQENNIPDDCINLYFSGNKGFAIHVFTDNEFTPSQFKAVTSSLAHNLPTYDSVVSNPSRLIRIPHTKHQESGLYKTRLSLSELNLTPKEIRELAQEEYEDAKPVKAELSESFLKLADSSEKSEGSTNDLLVSDKPDLTRNPLNLTPMKNALYQGFFPPGQRSNALMILTSTLKAKGMNEEECYSALKATIRQQAARYGQEVFSKEEFYQNIVEQVFSPLWVGGTYSEDNFPEAILQHLEELNVPRFNIDDVDVDLIVDIKKGLQLFTDYAKNIEENTMKFGIPSLDEKLTVQKGHLIGVLAGPGVGKTSLAIEIMNQTSKDKVQSYFGSYDMNSNIVFQKLLRRATRLSDEEIFNAYKNGDSEKIAKFEKILTKHFENVTFCFKVGQTIEDLKKSIKQKEIELGEEIGLVVVDYIELILTKSSDPTQASAEAAQGLREIANSGKVVLVLLQPNKMSSRADEPLLSYNAAKGSSAIAQAVTAMLTCHRPGYDSRDPSNDNYFSVNCVKNRMGALFHADFAWHGPTGIITELEDIQRKELAELRQMKKEQKEGDLI